jgi:hypothetical protein
MENFFSTRLPNNLLESIYAMGLKFFGVLGFVLLAWLLIRFILFVVRKSLRLFKANSKFDKFQKMMNIPFEINFEKVIVGFVKWGLILILVTIGADILGFTVISTEIGKIIQYIPKLISAIALVMVGLYLATLVKRTLISILKSFDLGGSRILGNLSYFAILILFIILGANQAGINTDIVTANLLMVVGAFIAAFALAMGLGSRDIVLRLILGFYSRKNLAIGTSVIIDDFEGTITAIDNICMTIENDQKKIIYPIKLITNKKVVIIK